MDDPAKVVIVLSVLATTAYSITAIARAAVAHKREEGRLERESVPPLTEARLARIEQAVDAIAVEVERISEGQRFTTRLLSEQSQVPPRAYQQQLPVNTPT